MDATSGRDRPESASSALVANLAVTRREVVIPPRFRDLMEVVAEYYGVRSTAEKLLKEFFHPLRNLDEIAKHLRSLCGGMFHYYEQSEARGRCFGLFNALFDQLYGSEVETDTLHAIVGVHLEMIMNLMQSRFRGDLEAQVQDALASLLRLLGDNNRAFLSYSGLIKRFGERLSADDPAASDLGELYRGVVEPALELFENVIDLDGWCRRQSGGLRGECGTRLARPVRQMIRSGRTQVQAAPGPPEVFQLPNIDDLLSLTLRCAGELSSSITRIAAYVLLAPVPELQYRNMEVVRTLHFAIKVACQEGDEDDIQRAADLLTDLLRDADAANKFLLYKCLEKLGEGIARRRNHKVTRHFVERTMATGFEPPDIRGVSDEWEVWVNSNHLRCLRCWLTIIEADPIQYEQLLSALVINLYFGGVFVSDTDLFQRDISALLNSDIAHAFNLILQVVAFFPVFFNEVGSEGELRDVSTRIDQLTHRRDPIIHYMRKQCHAESNNRLIGFASSVYRYWRSGDENALAPYLPDGILASLSPDAPWYRHVHEVVAALEQRHGLTEADLDTVPFERLQQHLDELTEANEVDRERTFLLVKTYRLLKAKYSFSPDQMLPMLEATTLVTKAARDGLASACATGDHLAIVRAGNQVLLELRQRIDDAAVTEPFENIYLKRHIAAGIPSMYGTYREPKFDSMSLFLRLIQFLKPHLEECVGSFNYRYMTSESIRQAHEIIEQMLIGLRIAGLRIHHLSTKLDILARGIALGTLSASQYLNIFDFMSEALNDVIHTNYIALHDPNLEHMAPQLLRRRRELTLEEDNGIDRASEEFFRDIISSTYAIQELDLFIRRICKTLRRMTATLSDQACGVVLNYQPDRLISFIDDAPEEHEDQLCLGYKGYSLKRLKSLGLPVPSGFVISTELFNIQDAMGYDDLRKDTRERIMGAVARMEDVTGTRFGDPEKALLMSVRSGSAFSMPGMMVTILNVGLTPEVVERLATDEHSAWRAWDSYRRYVQNVAMASGVGRDDFDEVMLRFKERYQVEKKLQFTAQQMQEMALEYRHISVSLGVKLLDEPVDQLMQAVWLVLSSWRSQQARLYREQLHLSDDWGTGVIVQEMVFGNIDANSGSGVAFTRDPRSSSTGIGLFGDFTTCSQGEDVVGGLVRPYPVSEKQRLEFSKPLDVSLERDHPQIFKRLNEIADVLLNDFGYEHQEIEFTFESAEPADLHLLQIRPMSLLKQKEVRVFAHPEETRAAQLGSGIGVSGGAMCGLVAFTEQDVVTFRHVQPERSIILLRPDTVPEDIDLVLAVDGLLTARGGFTSHAAVTAKRLGKCCVVNCSDLEVSESNRSATIGDHPLRPGDVISIDGFLGSVCAGEHKIVVSHTAFRLP